MSQSPSPLIGQRLIQIIPAVPPSSSSTVRYGTILYSGPVAGTKGGDDWLGVEWDNPARGRHSGEHRGVRYFQTKREGAGSFLRATTLREDGATFVGGRAFLAAVRERYLSDEDEDVAEGSTSQAQAPLAPLSRRNLAEIDIEAPNLAKIRAKLGQLKRLKVVSLTGPVEVTEEDVRELEAAGRVGPSREDLIDTAKSLPGAELGQAESEEIGEALPSIEHLDLSRTLMPSWRCLANIVQHLPRLHTLHAHQNRLALPACEADHAALRSSAGLRSLLSLGLDRTDTSWQDIQLLAPYLPELRTLQLAGNGIDSLHPSGSDVLARLEELNLEWNDLTSFHDLATLPALKRLHLSHNAIAHIAPSQRPFTLLEHVSLTGNPLFNPRTISPSSKVWESMHNLDSSITGGLRSLSVQLKTTDEASPPSMDEDALRLHLIARLPSLATLNGSPVSEMQRRDAEIWWAERMAMPSMAAKLDAASARTMERLKNIHFATTTDTPPAPINTQRPAGALGLKSQLVSVTLRLSDRTPGQTASPPTPTRSAPSIAFLPSMSLRTLRPKLLRSLKVSPREAGDARWFALMRSADSKSEEEGGNIVIELDDDSTPLNRYGLDARVRGDSSHEDEGQEDEIWVVLPS